MYFDVVADLYSAWVLDEEEALQGTSEQLDLSLSESDEEISFKPLSPPLASPVALPTPPATSNMNEAHPALHRFWDFIGYSKVRRGGERAERSGKPRSNCPLTQQQYYSRRRY
jgi:hypothetical protein